MLAAAVAVLVLSMAIIWVGCGDDAKEDTSASQLDDQAAGTSSGTTGTSTADSGQGNVLIDYTMDQCTQDMTARYGDAAKAQEVCSALQTGYSTTPISQLPAILPAVEAQVGATPLPGSTIPTGSSGSQPPGNNTSTPPGSSGGSPSGGGWETTITVPQGAPTP